MEVEDFKLSFVIFEGKFEDMLRFPLFLLGQVKVLFTVQWESNPKAFCGDF